MPAGGLLTAGISAGGSLLSGLFGGKSANNAAKIQGQNATKVADMATAAGNNVGTVANNAAGGVLSAAQQAGAGVTGAAQTSNNILGGVLGQQQANLSPYQQLGTQGAQQLLSATSPGGSLAGTFTGPNPQDISSTPEYQFQLQQGLQALQRSQSATGNLQSGGAQKAIAQYSQGLASNAYQQAYNNSLSTYSTNRNNTMNTLNSLLGYGQNATGQANSALSNFGNQAASNVLGAAQYTGNTGLQGATTAGQFGIGGAQAGLQAAQIAGNALTGGANAQAAGVIGQGNAIQGAIGGVTNAFNQYQYGQQASNSIPNGGALPNSVYRPSPVPFTSMDAANLG